MLQGMIEQNQIIDSAHRVDVKPPCVVQIVFQKRVDPRGRGISKSPHEPDKLTRAAANVENPMIRMRSEEEKGLQIGDHEFHLLWRGTPEKPFRQKAQPTSHH